MTTDIEKIVNDNDHLTGVNGNWRSYHQDLASFCLPRKAWQDSIRSRGEKLKFNFLYSSEAIRDLKIMAAGFHSNMTNPTTKWFGIQMRDIDLMDSYAVRMWLSAVENKMYSVIGASNFDTTMQEYYMDSGCFGTGVILVIKDYRDKVRYTIVPIEQLNLAEDAYGRINQVYRNFRLTASQAYGKWGNKAGKTVLDTYEKKPYDELDFIHYVGPRVGIDYSKEDALNMDYQSVWIAKKDMYKIDEGGFKENPYIVGRFWKDSNDVLGFSPAMDVLADTKTINAQTKTALRRAMKEADPPMHLPYKGFIGPLNGNPSAINYRKTGIDADAVAAFGVGAGNFNITKDMMQMTIQAIRDGFYVELFQTFKDITKAMPVIEAQKRISDGMALLGPAVGRQTYEVLTPLLTRTFNILYEAGEIPQIPEELQDAEMDFVFLGPLVKAQKQSDINPIQNFLQIVGGIAQVIPDALDNIDSDKTIDVIAKILTVNPEIMRDKEQLKVIRDARLKQQQAQAQMAMAQQAVTVGHTAAQMEKTGAEAKAVGQP